jgi:hypothetical protein
MPPLGWARCCGPARSCTYCDTLAGVPRVASFAVMTTSSVYLEVATDGITLGDVQAFTRGAAALGTLPSDPVERVMQDTEVAEADGDARAVLGELTRHRDRVRDLLLDR